MKILTTAILLFVTLLAVPLFSYFFGTAPGSLEWKAIFTLIKIGAFVIAYTFIVGELTKNYSQADKLWSIVPVVYVWVVAGYGDYSPIGFPDFMVAGLMLFFIVYEMVADVQQWNFQSKKYSMIRAGEELSGIYKKGFLDSGLWAHSRHPNYFAEQAIWICFYHFGITVGEQWFNWSISGCMLLVVLFQGSSGFSKEISAGKYPEYSGYQRRVPRFMPFGRK